MDTSLSDVEDEDTLHLNHLQGLAPGFPWTPAPDDAQHQPRQQHQHNQRHQRHSHDDHQHQQDEDDDNDDGDDGDDGVGDDDGEEDIGFDPVLFVSQPDRFLLCAICTQVCENPAEASCGHLFCREHITTWLATSSTCPVDRKTVDLKPEIHLLYRDRLSDLRIKCRNYVCGCTAVLEVKEYRKHVNSCEFTPRPCKWPGCPEKSLTGHNVDAHVQSCGYRPVRCDFGCNRLIAIRSKETHAMTECPNAEVSPSKDFMPPWMWPTNEAKCVRHALIVTMSKGVGAVLRYGFDNKSVGNVAQDAGCPSHVPREELAGFIVNNIYSIADTFKTMSELSVGLAASRSECRHLRSMLYNRMQSMVLHTHSDSTSTLAVSHSNTRLYSGSDDGDIRVWDISNRRHVLLLSTLRGSSRLNAVWCLFVHGDHLFAGRKEGQVEVWDIRDSTTEPKRVCGFVAHTHAVYALTASKSRLFTGSDDWAIHVWDISSLSTHKTVNFVCALKSHKETVYSLVVFNNTLISSSWDTKIKLWDISSDAITCVCDLNSHTDSVGPLLVYKSRLFSGGWDCSIKVWELSDEGGVPRASLLADLRQHTGNVYSLCASNGMLFSGAMDASIIVWDISGSDIVPLAVLAAHTDSVDAVVVVDERVFSSSQDRTIRVWF